MSLWSWGSELELEISRLNSKNSDIFFAKKEKKKKETKPNKNPQENNMSQNSKTVLQRSFIVSVSCQNMFPAMNKLTD